MRYRIVAHFLSEEIKKGFVFNISPDASILPLMVSRLEFKNINLDLVKAIFIVKTFDGNCLYQEKKEFNPGKTVYGRKLSVECCDGETFVGYTVSNPAKKKKFFLIPADPNSNNAKILLNRETIKGLRYL